MSRRSSLLSSVVSNNPNTVPSDAVADKLLISLKQNRPTSTKSNISLRIPSAKSTTSTNLPTNRSISQIDFPQNTELKAYKISIEIQNSKNQFDQKITETVIQSRGTGDSVPFHFEKYPEFYENYKPSLPFKQKKLDEDRRIAGEKVIKTFNYRYHLNHMQPQQRAIKPGFSDYNSILTGELNTASADIALRVQELKLQQEGYDMKILKPEQRKQVIAFGRPNIQPRTISDMVQLQEAEKFQMKLEQSDILGEKIKHGKNIGKYANNAFRRGAASQMSQSQYQIEQTGRVIGHDELEHSVPPQRPY
ncbi:hypothetical protein SS50377_25323 [Spironucleus salmonicida]|uniref:Uncharacterized protein n=1 Tax=Spironucleus salmonicida TaxID=348837 RepID=V6LBK4_9EUKA|nr:hypothetical protein SS50377_25323 [Spironucleus salmonicida]|eukprot:EST41797.1 hypothetical protein SS50377_18630 [Spironucleus salmonicida]